MRNGSARSGLIDALLEASGDAMLALDCEGRIIASNSQAEAIAGDILHHADIWNMVDRGDEAPFRQSKIGKDPVRFSGLVTEFGKIDGCLTPLAQASDDVAALFRFYQSDECPKEHRQSHHAPDQRTGRRKDECLLEAPTREPATTRPTSAALNSLILAEMPAILAVKDARTRTFLMTKGAAHIGLHANEEENVGKTADELFEPALAAAIKKAEDELIASDEILQERIFTTKIKDQERSFLSKRKVIRDDRGNADYILLINVDVTHEVEIHKQLERSQSFLHHVIQNLPCFVNVADTKTKQHVLTNFSDDDQADGGTETSLANRELLASMSSDFQSTDELGREMLEHWTSDRSRFLRVTKRILEDPIGETSYLLAVGEDVTERRVMLDTLKNSESNLQRSQKVAKIGSFLTDLRTGKIEWSMVLYNLWGTSPDLFSPSATTVLDRIIEEDRGDYLDAIRHVRRTGQNGTTKGRIRRFDGIILHVKVVIEPEIDEHGEVIRLFGIVQDISEQVRTDARMRYLAHHDGLTTLPNRLLFEERLARACIHAKRKGSGLAVHCIDINDFKGINDTLGHSAGDQMLRDVASRLALIVREIDTVARLGADEFAIIQEGIESAQDASSLAERAIESLKSPFQIEGQDIFSSSTVGISFIKNSRFDNVDLLQQANIALTEAKNSCRGKMRFFSPDINAALKRRQRIDQRIRHAMDRDCFKLAYQPQLCLKTDTIVGVEALMRWRDSELGQVPPDQFIKVAEDLGLILTLGEFALRRACADAKSWLDAGHGAMRVAVNLSPAQFAYQDLVDLVSTVLDETKLPPQLLELEITEGTLMRDGVGAVQTIKELHQLGVSMAIDDFGSGYSSLSYLKRFNVEKIKVDRAFVMELPHDPDDVTITRTIINLGRSLGMSVLAEGVEDDKQLTFLRDEGCDEIQGYFIAKPLYFDELTAFLNSEQYGVAQLPCDAT